VLNPDQSIVDGIDWTERPAHETYQSLIKDRATLEDLQAESDGHSLRLGEILDALEDHDDPPTKEAVQSFREEQDEIMDRVQQMDNEVKAIESRHEIPTASMDQAPDQPLLAAKFDF